jgi:hypothetical protein
MIQDLSLYSVRAAFFRAASYPIGNATAIRPYPFAFSTIHSLNHGAVLSRATAPNPAAAIAAKSGGVSPP